MLRKIIRENTGRMRAGQDLVVAGYAGLAGTRILAAEKGRELSRWFAAGYLEQIRGRKSAAEEKDPGYWEPLGAAEWELAGEGGILTAVWNLTGAYRLGAEFSLRRIPVRQETIELCERMNLNPYRLYSRGCWLLASENGGRLKRRLEEQGIFAEVIGSVTEGIARVITDNGDLSYLNRPQPDELERILPEWKAGRTGTAAGEI